MSAEVGDYVCPTYCTPSCEELCHEVHKPVDAQLHSVDTCRITRILHDDPGYIEELKEIQLDFTLDIEEKRELKNQLAARYLYG